jgi:hypothetical protein
MAEHKTLTEIIDTIKEHLRKSETQKVKNNEVAEAIGMTQQLLATYKARNYIPYDKLIDYCHNNKKNYDKLFFNQKP